jgi:hypothetical protein
MSEALLKNNHINPFNAIKILPITNDRPSKASFNSEIGREIDPRLKINFYI